MSKIFSSKETPASPSEGVIKFTILEHQKNAQFSAHDIYLLNFWRTILFEIKCIGEYPIEQVGFGNLSKRISKNEFLITASQTGKKAFTNQEDYSLVSDVDLEKFELKMKGKMPASSESPTHAALYYSSSEISCVFHIHHKKVWEKLLKMENFIVPKEIEYGTKEMSNFFRNIPYDGTPQCYAMEGHQDGIILFGSSLKDVGKRTLEVFLENTFS